jgi:hypothetical protein
VPAATTLHQIVALQTDVKNTALRTLTDVHHELQKPQLLGGQVRRYTPLDDNANPATQPADQVQHVQLVAETQIRDVAVALARLFDLTATKDATNRLARADVVVEGDTEPLLTDVPVTYLLFLEKQLDGLRTFIDKLPIHDPAVRWSFNDATGVWQSDPVVTVSNAKVLRNHVLAAATKEHQAQVTPYNEDVPVGTWATVRHSGALPATRVAELRRRVIALQEAVKTARERANTQPVVDKKGTGKVVLGWLFG